jgi:hypothetical protein
MRLPTLECARTLATPTRYMVGGSVPKNRHHILVARMPESGSCS